MTSDSILLLKKQELKSYLSIAQGALLPLINKDASRDEAIKVLSKLQYGQHGYFYGYDTKGTRVLLGKSSAGIGKNYWNALDKNGYLFIQNIINKATNGGGHTIYFFPKLNGSKALPKLSYSIYMPQWDLIIGTGFYIDDIEFTLEKLEEKTVNKLKKTLVNILIFTSLSFLVLLTVVIAVSRTITRPINELNKSIKIFINQVVRPPS